MKINVSLICLLFLLLNLISVTESMGQTPVKAKRNFDSNFKERYNTRKYNYEGTDVIRFKNDSKGENASYSDKKPRDSEDNNSTILNFNGSGFMPFAIVILVLAVVYLAYLLLNEGGGGLFTNKRLKKLYTNQDITADTIENTDLEKLIKKAETAENYRLAIRYNYLSVLKKLSLNGFINYEDEKTNKEYQEEIKDENLHKKFSYVSYLYSYIWYGEFSVNDQEYLKAKSNFNQLLQKI